MGGTGDALPSTVDDDRGRLAVRIGYCEVSVDHDEALNYALVHNGISPLQAVTIVNRGPGVVSDLGLEITIRGPVAGKIAEPFRAQLPAVEPGTTLSLDRGRARWKLDPETFAELDEAAPATIALKVESPSETATDGGGVRLLARDEWWAASIHESIAAFVTPRALAIRTLLDEVSAILAAKTGDSSLQGYQGGSDRAMEIARATYEAMQARGIRYINPPPSFEGEGQKIRPADEVLNERWGTCLDLAVTYAAAIEAAGLNPVIVICNGHAFAGHLNDDLQLPELVLRERRTIQNFVDSGALVPVETTALCDGRDTGFDAATGIPASDGWWSGRFDEVSGLIDIRCAHRVVRPIPAFHTANGTRVVEVETGPAPVAPALAAKQVPEPVEATPNARGGARPEETYPPRVERWRNSLLDLTFRNPLLNLRTGARALSLHVPKGSLAKLEDMVYAGQPISLLPHDDLAEIHLQRGARTAQDISPEELERLLLEEKALFVACPESSYTSRLRSLHRRARTVTEETGSNNLFIALGTLQWEDAGRDARAPLFLVPVTLVSRRGRPFHVQIDEGAYAQPNQCLLEKLRVSRGLTIPEFQDPETDESGIDLAASLQAIREALIAAELPFAVDETAHLAILQFSTLQLWQDLSENWSSFVSNPVVRHLVETPTDTFSDPNVDAQPNGGDPEANARCPISIDGSQLDAVLRAERGESFVLEGPPGTGKSQTITNLIANALSAGKKVMFVAEKQAALDVVKRRLDNVGLGELCLDLHGKGQTPDRMRSQLREALNLRVQGNQAAWDALRSGHEAAVSSLGRYPADLHEQGPTGLSIWTAWQSLLTVGDGPTVDVPVATVTAPLDTEAAYQLGRELKDRLYDLGVAAAESQWRLTEAPSLEGGARETLATAVGALDAAATAVSVESTGDLLERVRTADGLRAIADWLETAESGRAVVTPRDARSAAQPETHAGIEQLRSMVRTLRTDAAPLLEAFTPAAFVSGSIDAALTASREADSKLFKKKRRRAVAAGLASISRPGYEHNIDTLTPTLEQLVALRERTRQIIPTATAIPELQTTVDWNPLAEGADITLQHRATDLDAAATALTLAPEAEPQMERLATEGVTPGSASLVRDLHTTWTQFCAAADVRPDRLRAWQGDSGLVDAVLRFARAWTADAANAAFVQLGRWTKVVETLRRLEALGIPELETKVMNGELKAEEIEPAIRRGVARAVIESSLKSPAFAGFDGTDRDRDIRGFQANSDELRSEMLLELPAQITAQRSFQPDHLVGRAGELNRELGRKRGGMKIRELFAAYGEIIGELTPCLMMSPHSVARFMPVGALDIDLVVFDEASQIKVAESIGAMGRGKATVIVGDSQQMPPSAAFTGSIDEEDLAQMPGVPADMESVLSEAVESNLPQIWLSWHYRSKHESLISFSNANYYEGRLASFPRPPADSSRFGVSMRRVDGRWERGGSRTNVVEAEAIIGEVESRLASDPGSSIGVVTLNSQQRDLIMDRLEESTNEDVTSALGGEDEPLFVKNLENVQGDERDVILFSLAFSPDPETDKLALNFGPLTQAGGERRLNVAVTRARAEVVLFASFDSRHVDLARTSSTGMAHLRAYLEMAERGADDPALLKPPASRDRHRDEIIEALETAGLTTRRDVGLSDFKVDVGAAPSPDGPWTAIFLDGPEYSKRRTVSDREVLPHGVLTGSMGWAQTLRVWLPDWIRDQGEVLDRLAKQIKDAPEPTVAHEPAPAVSTDGTVDRPDLDSNDRAQMLREDEPTLDDETGERITANKAPATISEEMKADVATLSPDSTAGIDAPVAPTSRLLAERPAFRPAAEDLLGTRDTLDAVGRDPTATKAVTQEVLTVIDHEAPVQAARLAKIVARRFNLSRVNETRVRSIVDLVPPNQIEKTAFGDFIWARDQRAGTYDEFRPSAPPAPRDVEEIAPTELLNAMKYLAEIGGGIGRDELLRETADIFGIKRLTKRIMGHLEQVVDQGVHAGTLAEDGTGFLTNAARSGR